MDGLKIALGSRGMAVDAARRYVKDGKEWRALVHISMIEFNAVIIAWHCSFGPRSSGLSPGEG